MSNWLSEEIAGTPAQLHERDALRAQRTSTWCRPTSAQLVLGSTQAESIVDMEVLSSAGLTLARRRSGGGAVLVRPGNCVWVDAFIPRNDPLWQPDVGRAFGWFGAAWADALRTIGICEPEVHEGAYCPNQWGRSICFAGIGPGEVSLHGRKLVGISARRTREGAWFQSTLLLDAEIPLLAHLLRANEPELALAVGDIGSLGSKATEAEIVESLRSSLPS